MELKRKIVICASAFAGIGLGAVNVAEAQVCQHIGRWTRTVDGYVCSGHYTSGDCVWTDDCRKNIE